MRKAKGRSGKAGATEWTYTGLRLKLSIALLLATLPILALVGYVGLETTTSLLHSRVEASLRETVVAHGRLVQESLSRAAADARYLAQSDEVGDFAAECAAGREPSGPVAGRLLAEFTALGRATGLYHRLRYVDASGRERARLDLGAGPDGRGTTGKLDDFRHAPEFQDPTLRRSGGVHVSPLELDREGGRILRPKRPVVRYAAAVVTGGRFGGIVLLDAAPRPLLANPWPDSVTMFVADPDGWYCGHTDSGRAWSGPRNLATGYNAKADYGEASALMLRPVASVLDLNTRLVATSPVFLGSPQSGDYLLIAFDMPRAVALAGVEGFRRFFWIVLAISFIAPVAAGFGLGAFFLRPLHRLKRGVHSVAAGDLETRVEIRSGDEFQQLADDFNTMLAKLRELRQQERVAVVGHLAGNISHDIKNMLTPLQGCAETLAVLFVEMFARLDSALADPEVPEDAKQRIASAVAEMRDFYPDAVEMVMDGSLGIQDRVREIADYVKGVTAEPLLEPTHVAEVAEKALKPLTLVGHRGKVSVDLHCDDGLPAILADQRLLFSAIYNLVNNAIAATLPGGSVAVRVSAVPEGAFPEGAYLSVEVADTGKGIPEEIRAALFTANARSTKADGTGLGTRIVKNAVDAHGGTIAVESEPGKGSTFTIRLPLPPSKSPVAPASA